MLLLLTAVVVGARTGLAAVVCGCLYLVLSVVAVSMVSVVVMLCTRIGLSPPMPMSPMRTARVFQRS